MKPKEQEIKQAVKRVVKEYGGALRKLGCEGKWSKELSDFELTVPDGKMKGCLVYHEVTKVFIKEQIVEAEKRGAERLAERLMTMTNNCVYCVKEMNDSRSCPCWKMALLEVKVICKAELKKKT